MIESSRSDYASGHFRLLSEDHIQEIRRTAFEILEETGVRVTHREALKLLKSAGAWIKDNRVRLPRFIVEQCLQTAPKLITVYDRDGDRSMEVEGRKTYFGCSTGSPNILDPFTGKIRETRLEDIRLGAKICDALPNIDWVMPMGSCRDIEPENARDVFDFEALVTNTNKPIVMLSYSLRACEYVYEMAATIAGGVDELRKRPFLIGYPEPISPLVFPDDVAEKILFYAGLGMPQIPGSVCQMGATAPVTIAGAVAQNLAESLFSLVLCQLKKQGAPCFLSGNISCFDMGTARISPGAPESSLAISVQAEVAQSFGLPTWGLAGCSDSKMIDAQAGAESMFSIITQALAGLNLVHDVGYLDGSMVCSVDMLVLGDELIGMAKRFIEGVKISQETLGRTLISSVGPGGNFLQEQHTFDHFKKELWMPTLMTRQDYHTWQEGGGKDMATRVNEKVREISETHQIKPLPESTTAAIAELKAKAIEELRIK